MISIGSLSAMISWRRSFEIGNGNLERDRLRDIITSISLGGLRLVRVVLMDRGQIRSFAEFLRSHYPELDVDRLARLVVRLMFGACVLLLERIAGALDKKEIQELVDEALGKEPADEVLRYLTWLLAGDRFARSAGAGRGADVGKLETMWREQDDEVVRRIVSVATQRYINTHRVSAQSRQAIGATLRLSDQRHRPGGR